MTELLFGYDPISLEEMKSVRLMNRMDTKYLTTYSTLLRLLELASEEYRVQMVDGICNLPYYTLYFDTDDYRMYMDHLHGRKKRQKIRVRRYEASGLSFLEVKNKNNKGCTEKLRVPCLEGEESVFDGFVSSHTGYTSSVLFRRVENRFSRITLVNRNMTERLTIDTDIRFHNFHTGNVCGLGDLVIIELKRSGHIASPISDMLWQLRIHPAGFSKYCMGMALTDEDLKQNRFKPRLRRIYKISNWVNDIDFNYKIEK